MGSMVEQWFALSPHCMKVLGFICLIIGAFLYGVLPVQGP